MVCYAPRTSLGPGSSEALVASVHQSEAGMRVALALPILLAFSTALGATSVAISAAAANPAAQNIVRYEPRWDVQQSGAADDLYAVAFVSPLVGWAVGFNNTILATRDGGDSWT